MNTTQDRVLIIDDSAFFRRVVRLEIEERIGVEVDEATTLADAQQLLTSRGNSYFIALTDLILRDAMEGSSVELLASHGIPCVVFTSAYSDSVRRRMQRQQVIDYVVKDSPSSLHHLIDLVERLQRNRQCRILLADSDSDHRRYLRELLESYRFQVVDSTSGKEAMKLILADAEIQLAVVGYELSDMNGVEFVRQIRTSVDFDRLGILGMSSSDQSDHPVKFIKYGANDFLVRPFLREEFYCRVLQNVRMMELVGKLRHAATRDYLTGLYNRRFFFDVGTKMFASMQRGQIQLSVSMIDIDNFKQINDQYGHEAGDEVLRQVATILANRFRQTDVVARFGGEEFGILLVNMKEDSIAECFETLRVQIASTPVAFGDVLIPVTASFGVNSQPADSLQSMLEAADRLLYRAKAGGRNRIETHLQPVVSGEAVS